MGKNPVGKNPVGKYPLSPKMECYLSNWVPAAMDDLLKLHGQPATIDLQHEKINHDKMALMYLDLFTSSLHKWQLAGAFQQLILC